jgi:lipoprotein-releasing system ATP-binding protein
MDKIIELKKINKVYGTAVKTQVLFDIDLDYEPGSFNSIIGSSGSGKSTLLNIMSSLDKPTTGEVFLKGERVDQLSNKRLAAVRNETLGFIFQFHYLLPEFTALENVLMPYRIMKRKADKAAVKRAEELLELVGIAKVKNNLAGNMSGGQQQRTAIARSLINQPAIVFADEPTGNLDSDTTEVVYDLLRKINRERDTTFIIITHDRRIAEKTDRIIEIRDGRINSDFSRY